MNPVRIIPAIIAKSQGELTEKITKVKDCADLIQFDIMDGIFVPNESLNFDFQLPETDCSFEAHLMIDNPDGWVRRNWRKADTILIPIESCENPKETIDLLKSYFARLGASGKKIGFVLNPETSLIAVKNYLDEIDQVLIMTVAPGFYGAKFLPKTLNKVKELRKLRPEINIGVDGGINPETIGRAHEAGANFFVSGSYIINSENPKEAIMNLQNQLRD